MDAKKGEVSEIFQISRNTINLWLNRKEQTGDFLPEPNRPPGNNHKITDWNKFTKFASVNGDKTQEQMAQLWEGDISKRTISRALAKIGFTRKKTYGYLERDETKRQIFLEQLAKITPENLVYADKSGMDNRDEYAYGWNRSGQKFHALKSGKRQGRVNMIAAYCSHQLIAPFTVEGACNRTVFETWTALHQIRANKIPIPLQWH